MKRFFMTGLFVAIFAIGVVEHAEASYAPGRWAIGVQGSFSILDDYFPGGTALTFKVPQLPVIFGAGLSISKDFVAFGMTVDWWISPFTIGNIVGNPITFYYGPGLFLAGVGSENWALGFRVPLGIDIFILNGFIEPFVEIAPSIRLLSGRSIPDIGLTFAGAFGVRFWF